MTKDFYETNNSFRTDSLFVERIQKRHTDKGSSPIYTLNERGDKEGVENLYNIFINSTDEYDFATKAFASKAHLDVLKGRAWFLEGHKGIGSFRGYNEWLEDMKERDRSIAKRILMEKAEEGNVPAARALADLHKEVATKGRPKKEEVVREAVKIAEQTADIEDDFKRLNIVPIRG